MKRANLIPGPPYFFICLKCGHRFRRNVAIGLFCPECKWPLVIKDRSVRK